jgi:hypothetical protein
MKERNTAVLLLYSSLNLFSLALLFYTRTSRLRRNFILFLTITRALFTGKTRPHGFGCFVETIIIILTRKIANALTFLAHYRSC